MLSPGGIEKQQKPYVPTGDKLWSGDKYGTFLYNAIVWLSPDAAVTLKPGMKNRERPTDLLYQIRWCEYEGARKLKTLTALLIPG